MSQEDKNRPKPYDGSDKTQENQKEDIVSQMNRRENETEPFDSDENESGQRNTTGGDYATRQADDIGQGGPGLSDVENNLQNIDINENKIQEEASEEGEAQKGQASQMPIGENPIKVSSDAYEEGAIRKDDELMDPEKRLEDHPGAYQLKEKSVDEDGNSKEE